MMSKIYKIMCVACTATALSSCLDTIILPDDITVAEDFWKKKSDVALMVNAAYEGMTTENVMERMIVWGDFRSDEFVQPTAVEGTIPDALAELAAASTQVTNRYATWSDFYSVINKCNIVLEKAGEVRNEDPNYTEGDYLTDRSQMLALRSLCYFYLVRNFRDVPYIDYAYMNTSQERNFVQSSPAAVLQRCIESLEEAAANAIDPNGYGQNDWRRVGWFTKDGINALLADIYLWRASVLHSDADYQKAIDYCDLVIQSKKNSHRKTGPTEKEKTYPALADANRAYSDLFVNQNAEESLFELQIKKNPALCKYYYKYGSNSSTEGYLKASQWFTTSSTIAYATSSGNVFSADDIRYYSSIFKPGANAESFDVRKMISLNNMSSNTAESRTERSYADLDQNYIVYRLADVLLMKAEAQIQLVDTAVAGLTADEKTAKEAVIDAQLREAFNIIQEVNNRSLLSADSLKWGNLKSLQRSGKDGMEKLVLEERLRELCFEGKRWYDLMRYNYRHISGVNYDALLADIGFDALPANYDEMLTLVTRGRPAQQAGLMAKMRNEAFLYLPLPNSDVILSPQLKQNPVYGRSNEFERK